MNGQMQVDMGLPTIMASSTYCRLKYRVSPILLASGCNTLFFQVHLSTRCSPKAGLRVSSSRSVLRQPIFKRGSVGQPNAATPRQPWEEFNRGLGRTAQRALNGVISAAMKLPPDGRPSERVLNQIGATGTLQVGSDTIGANSAHVVRSFGHLLKLQA